MEIGGKRFWLGRDFTTATKIVQALDLAWDQTPEPKQWSAAEIKKCFEFAGVKPPETFERAKENDPQPADAPSPAPIRTAAFKPFANGGLTRQKALDMNKRDGLIVEK